MRHSGSALALKLLLFGYGGLMPRLFASELQANEMAEAFPLIRRLAQVSLEQWREFSRQLADKGGGVIAVRAEDRKVHGVATYVPVASLRYRRALRVDAIAAFEFGHSSPVREALSAALDKMARAKDCEVILIGLDAKGLQHPRSRRRIGWESLGLSADSIEFVRHLHASAKAASCE